MRRWMWMALVCGGGCIFVEPPGTTTDGTSPIGDGLGPDEFGTMPALPVEGLDGALCENVSGLEQQAGASTYFYGDFVEGDTLWTGQEWLVYLANDDWVARGGQDCVMVWDVQATTEAGGGNCAICTWTLAVTARLNESLTSCPPSLSGDFAQQNERYAVAELGGDAIELYFAGSGNFLSGGTLQGGQLEYLTEGSCSWF